MSDNIDTNANKINQDTAESTKETPMEQGAPNIAKQEEMPTQQDGKSDISDDTAHLPIEPQADDTLDIDEKIKDFLNKYFAQERISAALIQQRQSLKNDLLDKIEECRTEGIAEELVFETAVSRLPTEVIVRSEQAPLEAARYTPSKDTYILLLKTASLAMVAVAEALYLILSWINDAWFGFAPLAFIPLFALFYWFAAKRLKWNFTKKRHNISPLIFMGLITSVVFTVVFFVYGLLALNNFIIVAILAIIALGFAYQILEKLFVNKYAITVYPIVSLAISLVIVPLFATLFYILIRRFLPDFKFVWLVFVAAAVVDGVIVFAHLPLKIKKNGKDTE